MRRITQGTALVLAALLTACATDTIEGPTSSAAPPALTKGASLDATFTYATVDVPNSTNTTAWGINPGGDIVGSYTDATGLHGFLLHDGAYTSINYPGAARTQARGIGPAGDIVGNYSRRGEVGVSTHGFLLTRDGEFRPIDYDPHPNTIAQRILPDGTILGCLHDGDTMDSMHGIAIGRGGRSELAQPATMNNGGTPNGRRLTGLFTDTDNRTKGYLLEDGVFTSFMVPQSIFTAAWDMNPAGEIAGAYADAASHFHGFVRLGDSYAALDVAGAVATRAFGINPGGSVVGAYVAGGRTHGFIATPASD